jgi:hypothetical protein
MASQARADWTDPDTPELHPYPRAKAISERAVWDFIEHEGGGIEPLARSVAAEEGVGDTKLPDGLTTRRRKR